MPLASHHHKDLDCLYGVLAALEQRIGKQRLRDCHGRMGWPRRGVYFFFEDGELRPDGVTPRVVRVGTHAVSAGSRTTLWNRLSTHRGTRAGGGNHRGSIFRLLVGEALLERDPMLRRGADSWGEGSSAPRPVRDNEVHIEQAVSEHIGAMPFLFIEADDEPGAQSMRRTIESNAIALLSAASPTGANADAPSPGWLGLRSPRDKVRASGLWNIRNTEGVYDASFLDLLASCAEKTRCP